MRCPSQLLLIAECVKKGTHIHMYVSTYMCRYIERLRLYFVHRCGKMDLLFAIVHVSVAFT
jgi:hypothetical protein